MSESDIHSLLVILLCIRDVKVKYTYICRIKYENSNEDTKNVERESEISAEAENLGSAKHFHPWCMAFKNVKKLSEEIFIFRGRMSYFVIWRAGSVRRRLGGGTGRVEGRSGRVRALGLFFQIHETILRLLRDLGEHFQFLHRAVRNIPARKKNENCYVTLKI